MTLPLLRPFPALRPDPDRAGKVAAPPYDVLDSDEARAYAQGNPWSFLHVSKPEIDLAPGTDPTAPEAYAKAAENFRRMIDEGVLRRDPVPAFYVYRIAAGDFAQAGIVGAASVVAYETGRIRRHELTRPSKEDDRVRQIEAIGAHTGPAMVAHRPNATIAEIVEEHAEAAPDFAVLMEGGVHHSIRAITDESSVAALIAAFEGEEALYMADGHHRSNAAARVAQARRARPGATPDAWHESFLTVVFPADQMRILDYNRTVRDLGGLDAPAFLAEVAKNFAVESSTAAAKPGRRGEFGMYLDGRWYRLTPHEKPATDADAVSALDISVLTGKLLEPILGIGDPRLDARIDFVGGVRGLGELERRVDRGDMAVAFAVYPTSMADLMAVSDAGQIMPPKSTWFEPKLADGLVSLLLD